MSNSNLQQLHLLCVQMYNEGKTPSVGILRSKAPFKVSVTDAIEAIKRFNAHKPTLETSSETQPLPQTERKDHSALSARVEALENEVAELKRALKQITTGQ